MRRRTFVATAIAFAQLVIIVGWAILTTNGAVLLSMSPDEFLIPLAIQIAVILIFSMPIALLVARSGRRKRSLSNVFD